MQRLGAALLAASITLAPTAPFAATCPATDGPHAASVEPIQHPWTEWQTFVEALAVRMRSANLARAELVFLGDSLVFAWSPEIFAQFYGHHGAINLGIPGDTTQTLLWRLRNGHWPPALQPRAIVLLIGTNNTAAGMRAEATAQGVSTVLAELRQRAPQARILLLGLLPRGPNPRDPARTINAAVNALIAPCANDRRVFWADPGQLLVDGAGNLSELIAYDRLHLTMLGYAILSGALDEPLSRLLARR